MVAILWSKIHFNLKIYNNSKISNITMLWRGLLGSLKSGFVPFFRKNSRTSSGLRLIFPGFYYSHQPFHSQDFTANSPCSLKYISYFLLEFNRFPELSGTSSLFPGLPSPRKCHSKIPGLSRFSRTRTNPLKLFLSCSQFPVWNILN